MGQVLLFVIVVILFAIFYTFVSTFVVPILALYVLLRGWNKANETVRWITIVLPIISLCIVSLGLAMSGDPLGNIDITAVMPIVSIALVIGAYAKEKANEN